MLFTIRNASLATIPDSTVNLEKNSGDARQETAKNEAPPRRRARVRGLVSDDAAYPAGLSLLADPTPPLSVWFLKQSFDTAKECESARRAEDHEAELEMHDITKARAIETEIDRVQIF